MSRCANCRHQRRIAVKIEAVYSGTLFHLCTHCGWAQAANELQGELWEIADLYAQRHNQHSRANA